MKKLPIQVCVCTNCVMNGAMDLVESIETLKNLADDLDENFDTDISLDVTTVKNLGDEHHSDASPCVKIGDKVYHNVNSQTMMAEILMIISKDVKHSE